MSGEVPEIDWSQWPVLPDKAYVYALIDPRTGEEPDGGERYIGKTINVAKRYRNHLRDSRTSRTHNGRWIASLLRLGLAPGIRVLECCDRAVMDERERWYIADRRARGVRLTNLTDGGDGAPGCVRSPETRAKLAAAARRRTHSPETRAKIGAASRARTRSPETRAKLSAVMRGNTYGLGYRPSPEARAKLSAAMKGNTNARGSSPSPDTRAKLAAASRGRTHSPESRAKLSAAHKGRTKSPEHRAKISAALTGRKLSPDTRAKISAANRGNTHLLGHRHSPETRAKLSAAHQRRREAAQAAQTTIPQPLTQGA